MPVATTPAAVTVITEQDIQNSNTANSVDLLETTPFLNLNQTGGLGGLATVSLRGGKPNFTLVMADGIPLNDITNTLGGAFDFSTLDASNVRQIEIVRGPLSSIYGSDAVAGVINFISPRGEGEPTLDVSAEAGSFWTRSARLHSAGQIGRFEYSTSGLIFDIGQQVLNDHYRLGSFAFHGGAALSANKVLQYTARYNNSLETDFPIGGGGPEYSIIRQPQHITTGQFVTGLTFEHSVSPLWTYHVALDFSHQGQNFQIPAILDGPRPSANSQPPTAGLTNFDRYRGNLINSFHFTPHLSARAAGEFREERGDRNATLAQVVPDRFSLVRSTSAAVAELLYSSDQWTLTAGARADKTGGYRAIYSPRVGISYRLGRNSFRLHSSWGKGYKLPSFYSLGDPLIGNKLLRPEFSESVDGGLSGDLFRNRLRMDFTYFTTWYRDLVDFSAREFRLVNRAQVQTRGVEYANRWSIRSNLILSGSLGYLDWSLYPADEPFRDVPHWRGTATIDWQPSSRWHFGADSTFVGRRFDFELPVPSQDTVGGYSLVNLRSSYQLTSRLTAFVRIDNVLNQHFHQYVGFPDPGIYVRSGLTFEGIRLHR